MLFIVFAKSQRILVNCAVDKNQERYLAGDAWLSMLNRETSGR